MGKVVLFVTEHVTLRMGRPTLVVQHAHVEKCLGTTHEGPKPRRDTSERATV